MKNFVLKGNICHSDKDGKIETFPNSYLVCENGEKDLDINGCGKCVCNNGYTLSDDGTTCVSNCTDSRKTACAVLLLSQGYHRERRRKSILGVIATGKILVYIEITKMGSCLQKFSSQTKNRQGGTKV